MKLSKILIISCMVILNGRCAEDDKDKAGVDYVIVDAQFPLDLHTGNAYTIKFFAKNRGDRDGAREIKVKLYIDEFYYLEESRAIYLNEVTSAKSISADETWDSEIQFTLPPESPATGYFLLKIESTDDEINKFNNIASSGQIIVAGGSINRTEIPVDNQYHDFEIKAFETRYYFFNGTQGHAYQVFWDDLNEGIKYFDIGADIMVTSKTEDLGTIYFSEIDSGYNSPQPVSVVNTGKVLLDLKSSSVPGGFSVKIKDMGVPPDLSITLDSHKYSNSTNTLDLTFTVKNGSTVGTNSACFYIGFWFDRASEPTKDEVADYYANLCPNIAPGGQYTSTANIPCTIKNGIAFAYADVYGNMVEGNEANNVSLPYTW